MKTRITVILMLLFTKNIAQVKDTLYFFNQSIVMGELKKINLGKIDFSVDGIGDVRIKYDKVRTMKAASHAYRIETTAKELLYGTIESSLIPGCIIVNTLKGKIIVKLNNITSLSFYGQSWKTKLSGEAGAGYSYTKSSKIGRLNINSDLHYINRKLEAVLEGNTIITSDSSRILRERENLLFSFNYLINNSWYTGVILRYQRNLELGLLRRWQEGAGVGYKFVQRQKSIGKSITGLVVNEEYNYDHSRNTSLEWVLQGNYNFYSFSKPDITMSTTQTIYFSLSQNGRTRYDGDIRINWKLIKDFSLNLSLYDNYDSRSPVNNKSRNDYGFIAGLNYEF